MSTPIIRQLLSVRGLAVECPQCTEDFPVKKAKLFSMYAPYPPVVRSIIDGRIEAATELKQELTERSEQLKENKKKKPLKITVSAQACNFGKIAEQIVPAFLTFPYIQNECRPLFEPIDYIIFSGLSEKGRVHSIKFVDMKTGDGRLSRGQRQIRDRVLDGKVSHRIADL